MGWAFVIAWIFLLTAAVCWPLFIPYPATAELTGPPMFVLRDMVIAPHPPLTDATLGLGEAAARAVPQDTALWALGYFVDAAHWVRFLMVGACILGGLAAAELARTLSSSGTARNGAPRHGNARHGAGVVGQFVAPTMLLWNPFVVERLLQGQWSLVLAALLLPVVVLTVRQGWVLWRTSAMAVAALTPTGALLAAVVALVSARNNRDRAWIGLTALLCSAPWLVATTTNFAAAAAADRAGAAAFAARAENHVGTLGALLGLGGIWNQQAVPASREIGVSALMVVALLALFALGWSRVWQSWSRLIVLAASAIAAIALAATPWGIALMGWLQTVPGGGLLRDTQKWVALALPAYVLLAAAGADYLAVRARATAQVRQRRIGSVLAAVVSVLVIVSAVPTLPRDLAPLRPVPSWPGWSAVSGVMAIDGHAVAVLPAGSYRLINGRPALDPALKILPNPVINSGELVVSGRAVSGEGSATIERTLLDGAANAGEATHALNTLRHHGVGWVLAENSPGNFGASVQLLGYLDLVYADEHLQLYHVPGAIERPEGPSQGAYLAAWLAFLVWVSCVFSGVLFELGRSLAAGSGRSGLISAGTASR